MASKHPSFVISVRIGNICMMLMFFYCSFVNGRLTLGRICRHIILKQKCWKPNNHIWAVSRQNQQNGMCAQQRLGSAWASMRSGSQGPKLYSWGQRRLIRLGRCPGWSESSLGAHAVLLVLSWGSSYQTKSWSIDLCSVHRSNQHSNAPKSNAAKSMT